MAWANRAPGPAPSTTLLGTERERWANRPATSRLSEVTGKAENIILLRKYPSLRGPKAVQQFVFPVNPESIRVSMRRETVDISILRQGTISRLGANVPIEVSFDGFLPRKENLPQYIPWINVPWERLPEPWAAVRELRGWQMSESRQNSLSPLLLTILDTHFHLWCVMTTFDIETRPREVGDVYFSVAFREAAMLPQIKKKKVPSTKSARQNPRTQAGTITTKPGDNLARIAKRVYGEADKRHIDALYAVNKKAVGNNRLKVLPAKTKIVLPNLARAA